MWQHFSIYIHSAFIFQHLQQKLYDIHTGAGPKGTAWGGGKSWVEKGVRGAELNHTLYYTSETILHLN